MQTRLIEPSCAADVTIFFLIYEGLYASLQDVTKTMNPLCPEGAKFGTSCGLIAYIRLTRRKKIMRPYVTLLSLTLWVCTAWAQDPGMMAAQEQAQMAAQAAQQANDQMMQAVKTAAVSAQMAQQQAIQNTTTCCCGAGTPKFSVKPGAYSAAVTLRIRDSTRGAVIYYTTDGWTPTAASTRYTGPITI